MGTYFRGVSKRTVKVEGIELGLTNFYGKAPSVFDDNARRRGHWDRFCTKASNTAAAVDHKYVIMSDKLSDDVVVAKWKGASVMGDDYWDKMGVGKLVKKPNGRYTIEWNDYKLRQEAEETIK